MKFATFTAIAVLLMVCLESVHSTRTYYPGVGYVNRKSSSEMSLKKNVRAYDDMYKKPRREVLDEEESEAVDDDDVFVEERPRYVRTRPTRYRTVNYRPRPSRYSTEEDDYRPSTYRRVRQPAKSSRQSRLDNGQNFDGSNSYSGGYAGTSNGGGAFSGSFASSNGKNSNAYGFGAAFSAPNFPSFDMMNRRRQDSSDLYEDRPRISCIPQKSRSSFGSLLWVMACGPAATNRVPYTSKASAITTSTSTTQSPVEETSEVNGLESKKKATFSPKFTKDFLSHNTRSSSQSLSSSSMNRSKQPSFKSSSIISVNRKFLEEPSIPADWPSTSEDRPIYGNDMLHYAEASSPDEPNFNGNTNHFMEDPNNDFVILKR